MGMTQQFFVFLSLETLIVDLDLRTRARFLYNVPSLIILRLVVRKLSYGQTLTNEQTPLKTSTSLRYATPVGNYTPAIINSYYTIQVI